MPMNTTLTALTGIKVGHATHTDALTGCTFILFPRDLPVAYSSFGGGAGTYNTDMLRNGKSFNRRHGLFIAGGSQSGLMSAQAIMQKLIAHAIGYRDGVVMNPLISGAIVFDLGMFVKQYKSDYGAEAFDACSTNPVARGNFGAGTGATVGKFMLTTDNKMLAMKSGIGCARKDLGNGVIITALSVVNAVGNIINNNGSILAGNRNKQGGFYSFEDVSTMFTTSLSNTTVTIVGINVNLHTRENYEKVSHMASQGHVRAISPVNLSIDGDTVFVFSTEEIDSFLSPRGKLAEENYMTHNIGVDIIGHAASQVVQESIYDSCKQAESIEFANAYQGVIPSCKQYISLQQK
jgi:L-aminopeptidase/D-esterase-like protein